MLFICLCKEIGRKGILTLPLDTLSAKMIGLKISADEGSGLNFKSLSVMLEIRVLVVILRFIKNAHVYVTYHGLCSVKTVGGRDPMHQAEDQSAT